MSSKRWALFRKFEVKDEKTGELYLRRWYIVATPWFSVLLHRIQTPDKDRHPHDHPWSFLSFMLWGSYDEKLAWRVDGKTVPSIAGTPIMDESRREWLSVAFRRAEDVHKISKLHRTPTWTLLLTGPRRREWFFHTEHGPVHWRRYLGLE